MKTLNIINDSVFKLADTGSLISFKAFDGDYNVKFTKDDQLQFRIRNKTGYVMSVAGIVSSGGYWVNLDTGDLSKLTPDTYECELWDTKNGETDIYPDNGFVPFTVTANANVITGSTLPEITLDEYETKFEKYCNDEVESAKLDIKAYFQKFVDEIQDNAINVAKKASQDVATLQTTTSALSTMIQNISQSLSAWNNSQEIGGASTNIDFNQLNSGVYSVIGWYSNVMNFPNFPTIMNNKEFMMFVYKTTTGNVTLQIIINADLQFYIRSLAPGGVENVGWKQIQVLG